MIGVMDAVDLLLDEIETALPQTRRDLRRLKASVASRTHSALLRNEALLARYRQDLRLGCRQPQKTVERILQLNRIRSQSGIATVTVITKPYACPGRCVYCPTEARAPKSYLTNEPAVMRALRNDYDPFRQTTSRLQALHATGHATDKIELIIKGGTWSFYPEAYQEWFIQRCVDAATLFGDPAQASSAGLEDAQRRNEAARSRIIGLTVETRPDYVTGEELWRLRRLGVTRVELGVQSLEDRILELTARDHTTAEVRTATRLLRDAGFKVAYHLMPNLPGASPDDDRRTFEQLFEDPAYRPDAIKIYPCVVIETAELYRWWQQGGYQPYDDDTLVSLLMDLKRMVPPYVRIERVIRDIPSPSIVAGCRVTNLRQEVHRRMREQGLRCRCIRCREVRDIAGGTYQLVRRDYEASGGREIFLSIEDPAADRLASLLRLRLPGGGTALRPCLEGAALIRELHTYGPHVPLHGRHDEAAQHRGFGRRLLAEAERVAREELGCRQVAVIAGVGVREYYRKLGYALRDTYMVKALGAHASSNGRSPDEIS